MKRLLTRVPLRLLALALILSGSASLSAAAAETAKRPNILFVFADA